MDVGVPACPPSTRAPIPRTVPFASKRAPTRYQPKALAPTAVQPAQLTHKVSETSPLAPIIEMGTTAALSAVPGGSLLAPLVSKLAGSVLSTSVPEISVPSYKDVLLSHLPGGLVPPAETEYPDLPFDESAPSVSSPSIPQALPAEWKQTFGHSQGLSAPIASPEQGKKNKARRLHFLDLARKHERNSDAMYIYVQLASAILSSYAVALRSYMVPIDLDDIHRLCHSKPDKTKAKFTLKRRESIANLCQRYSKYREAPPKSPAVLLNTVTKLQNLLALEPIHSQRPLEEATAELSLTTAFHGLKDLYLTLTREASPLTRRTVLELIRTQMTLLFAPWELLVLKRSLPEFVTVQTIIKRETQKKLDTRHMSLAHLKKYATKAPNMKDRKKAEEAYVKRKKGNTSAGYSVRESKRERFEFQGFFDFVKRVKAFVAPPSITEYLTTHAEFVEFAEKSNYSTEKIAKPVIELVLGHMPLDSFKDIVSTMNPTQAYLFCTWYKHHFKSKKSDPEWVAQVLQIAAPSSDNESMFTTISNYVNDMIQKISIFDSNLASFAEKIKTFFEDVLNRIRAVMDLMKEAVKWLLSFIMSVIRKVFAMFHINLPYFPFEARKPSDDEPPMYPLSDLSTPGEQHMSELQKEYQRYKGVPTLIAVDRAINAHIAMTGETCKESEKLRTKIYEHLAECDDETLDALKDLAADQRERILYDPFNFKHQSDADVQADKEALDEFVKGLQTAELKPHLVFPATISKEELEKTAALKRKANPFSHIASSSAPISTNTMEIPDGQPASDTSKTAPTEVVDKLLTPDASNTPSAPPSVIDGQGFLFTEDDDAESRIGFFARMFGPFQDLVNKDLSVKEYFESLRNANTVFSFLNNSAAMIYRMLTVLVSYGTYFVNKMLGKEDISEKIDALSNLAADIGTARPSLEQASEIVARYDHLQRLQSKFDNKHPLTGAFTRTLQNCKSLFYTSKLIMAGSQPRGQPPFIHIVGHPGSGKSTIVPLLVSLALKCNLTQANSDIYMWDTRTGFQDGFNGQPAIVINDIFNAQDEQIDIQTVDDILHIVSTEFWNAPVASPEKKSQIPVAPKVFITTSNVIRFPAAKAIRDPNAFLRRRTIVVEMIRTKISYLGKPNHPYDNTLFLLKNTYREDDVTSILPMNFTQFATYYCDIVHNFDNLFPRLEMDDDVVIDPDANVADFLASFDACLSMRSKVASQCVPLSSKIIFQMMNDTASSSSTDETIRSYAAAAKLAREYVAGTFYDVTVKKTRDGQPLLYHTRTPAQAIILASHLKGWDSSALRGLTAAAVKDPRYVEEDAVASDLKSLDDVIGRWEKKSVLTDTEREFVDHLKLKRATFSPAYPDVVIVEEEVPPPEIAPVTQWEIMNHSLHQHWQTHRAKYYTLIAATSVAMVGIAVALGIKSMTSEAFEAQNVSGHPQAKAARPSRVIKNRVTRKIEAHGSQMYMEYLNRAVCSITINQEDGSHYPANVFVLNSNYCMTNLHTAYYIANYLEMCENKGEEAKCMIHTHHGSFPLDIDFEEGLTSIPDTDFVMIKFPASTALHMRNQKSVIRYFIADIEGFDVEKYTYCTYRKLPSQSYSPAVLVSGDRPFMENVSIEGAYGGKTMTFTDVLTLHMPSQRGYCMSPLLFGPNQQILGLQFGGTSTTATFQPFCHADIVSIIRAAFDPNFSTIKVSPTDAKEPENVDALYCGDGDVQMMVSSSAPVFRPIAHQSAVPRSSKMMGLPPLNPLTCENSGTETNGSIPSKKPSRRPLRTAMKATQSNPQLLWRSSCVDSLGLPLPGLQLPSKPSMAMHSSLPSTCAPPVVRTTQKENTFIIEKPRLWNASESPFTSPPPAKILSSTICTTSLQSQSMPVQKTNELIHTTLSKAKSVFSLSFRFLVLFTCAISLFLCSLKFHSTLFSMVFSLESILIVPILTTWLVFSISNLTLLTLMATIQVLITSFHKARELLSTNGLNRSFPPVSPLSSNEPSQPFRNLRSL